MRTTFEHSKTVATKVSTFSTNHITTIVTTHVTTQSATIMVGTVATLLSKKTGTYVDTTVATMVINMLTTLVIDFSDTCIDTVVTTIVATFVNTRLTTRPTTNVTTLLFRKVADTLARYFECSRSLEHSNESYEKWREGERREKGRGRGLEFSCFNYAASVVMIVPDPAVSAARTLQTLGTASSALDTSAANL